MGFAGGADSRVKLKESEKRDKHCDLAGGLKNLWNIKVTVIPILIGALGTVIKRLIQGLEDLEIRGRVESIYATVLLRSVRIPRRVLKTCHSDSSEKIIIERWSEKLSNEKNNNNDYTDEEM